MWATITLLNGSEGVNDKTNICLVLWSLLIFVVSEASDPTYKNIGIPADLIQRIALKLVENDYTW